LDLTASKIYWTDYNNNLLQRSNLDGSNIENLIVGDIKPKSPALDIATGKIYWTEWHEENAGRIRRSNLDGSNIENLVTNDQIPTGLALDVSAGKMYWTELGGSIRKANLDGSNIEYILSSSRPIDIALYISGTSPSDTDAPDDVGNSKDTATAFTAPTPISSTTPYYSYLPTYELTRGDIDFFRIEVKQRMVLQVYSFGDLDLRGQLIDSNERILFQDDNSGGAPANFFLNSTVNPGTYYLKVEGVRESVSGNYSLALGTLLPN